MSNALLWIAAVLTGLTVVAALIGGRAWMMRKWERDKVWMRETARRFRPEPINETAYAAWFYIVFGMWLILLLLVVPSIVIALLIWGVSWLVPGLWISWMWRRRLRQIDVQIPQTVSTLSNSMRAGLTLVQAVTRISEQGPEPIRSEFKIMANQYGYGADMDTVIRNAKARLDLPNFSLFASALLLNREMGGDISETLTRISKSLEKLREMRKTVEAHTAEGRTNIKVLLAAPVFILCLMAVVMPRGVGLLFTTAPGWSILMLAGVLSTLGVYFAARITRSEI